MRLLLVILAAALSRGCFGADEPSMQSAVLYLPNDEMVKRGADVQTLADYIKAVKPLVIAAIKHPSAEEFAVVVAWDNQRVLVYGEAKEPEVKADILSATADIRKLKAPPVKGPMIFGIIFGFVHAAKRYDPVPMPSEWKSCSGSALPIPDCLFEVPPGRPATTSATAADPALP